MARAGARRRDRCSGPARSRPVGWRASRGGRGGDGSSSSCSSAFGGARSCRTLEALIAAASLPRADARSADAGAVPGGPPSGRARRVPPRTRALLVEDLGLEPGPELAGLEAAILAQDPAARGQHISAAQGREGHSRTFSPRSRPRWLPRIAAGRRFDPRTRAELHAGAAPHRAADVRVVTLTGPGGIGKTRLALELAGSLAERSRFVELAAVERPRARTSGHRRARWAPRTAARRRSLAALGAGARRAVPRQLRAGARGGAGRRLAAQRGRRTERRCDQPRSAAHRGRARAPRAAAVASGRSRAVHSGAPASTTRLLGRPGELDVHRGTSATASIGLPLAIELAAARTRVLARGEILDRIGRRLDLLTAGRRDAPERHRTLRATSPGAMTCSRSRSSGCSRGWRCSTPAGRSRRPRRSLDEDVVEPLSELVDQALVIRDGSRFTMLETVREYAAERLEESGEAQSVAARHARWCVALAASRRAGARGASAGRAWFARLDREQENLRAACGVGRRAGRAGDSAGASTEPFGGSGSRAARPPRSWSVLRRRTRCRGGEGRSGQRPSTRPAILAGASRRLRVRAQRSFEEALELVDRSSDDRRQMGRALVNLGMIALFTEDYAAALDRFGAAWRSGASSAT